MGCNLTVHRRAHEIERDLWIQYIQRETERNIVLRELEVARENERKELLIELLNNKPKFIKIKHNNINEECVICLEKKENEVRSTVCNHTFCKICIMDWYIRCIIEDKIPHCPTCRKKDNKWGKKYLQNCYYENTL